MVTEIVGPGFSFFMAIVAKLLNMINISIQQIIALC